tara:strand:- start:5006 stop:6787 length:1782 start_codon:yes stop_codon:yes gene_type:complete
MMDFESQAVPSSRDPAPHDVPRDGIDRATGLSPDENRDAPAAAPVVPPAKRARTVATERVKSFDGAKQFIAQLREAEEGREEEAEEGREEPATVGGNHETANAVGKEALDEAAINEAAQQNVSLQRVEEENLGGAANGHTDPSQPAPPSSILIGNLDAFEEDAIHVLSGLFEEETMSQALSDANNGLASTKKRRSSVSKPSGSKGAEGGSNRGGRGVSTNGKASELIVPIPSTSGEGPSGSRKAADHRRLLKSYMKALFRHLKLPVDGKPAESATYRDRINSALCFWFGNTFVPGKTTVECNAPKIVCALVYLATYGRVTIQPDDVRQILRKGLNAKNANYTVDEGELKRLGVSICEIKGLFTGASRVEKGFPRGLPLHLPDLDALPKPVGGVKGGLGKAKGDGKDELVLPKSSKDPTSKPSKETSTSLKKTEKELALPSVEPPDEGLGESGGTGPTVKHKSKTHAAFKTPGGDRGKDDARVPSSGSPLFSPVGGVTAAFAAAALMPEHGDRSAVVADFVQKFIEPALHALDQYPAETQLEMLNCAQGAFVKRAAGLAKESHRAAAADRELAGGTDDVPAATGRGKRARGGKK